MEPLAIAKFISANEEFAGRVEMACIGTAMARLRQVTDVTSPEYTFISQALTDPSSVYRVFVRSISLDPDIASTYNAPEDKVECTDEQIFDAVWEYWYPVIAYRLGSTLPEVQP